MTDGASGSVSFDPIATRYDATRGYPPAVAAEIAAGLLRLAGLPPEGRLLEIGVGTGRIALPLALAGAHVTGVDISPRMLDQLAAKIAALPDDERARIQPNVETRVADMTRLPFADGAFDAVVAVHVLHLVPEWRRALDDALRVLSARGVFLLGQDVRTAGALHRVHDQWDEIIRELGYMPRSAGAAGYDEIVGELRARGLRVGEETLTSWELNVPPRAALDDITTRSWSRTWRVPDDLFAESARRLAAWAEREYGAALDTPQPIRYAFKVAVARRA